MSEKHIVVHEQHETTHLTHEQLKAHHEQLEKARHEKAEKARHDQEKDHAQAEKLAATAEALSTDEIKQASVEQPQTERRHTSEDKAHSFATTMHHVRQKMSAPERTLSKIIHQPVVEKTSEFAGKTVARPSGVIGATVAAFIGLLSIYSIARFAGFQLSGSEMPLLLVIGFAFGLLVEWSYKAFRSLVLPYKS